MEHPRSMDMYITMDDGSWDPPSHDMMVSTRAMDMLSMKLMVYGIHQHSSYPLETEYGVWHVLASLILVSLWDEDHECYVLSEHHATGGRCMLHRSDASTAVGRGCSCREPSTQRSMSCWGPRMPPSTAPLCEGAYCLCARALQMQSPVALSPYPSSAS